MSKVQDVNFTQNSPKDMETFRKQSLDSKFYPNSMMKRWQGCHITCIVIIRMIQKAVYFCCTQFKDMKTFFLQFFSYLLVKQLQGCPIKCFVMMVMMMIQNAIYFCHLGKPVSTKTDDFLENFLTAFAPPPPLFREKCCNFVYEIF